MLHHRTSRVCPVWSDGLRQLPLFLGGLLLFQCLSWFVSLSFAFSMYLAARRVAPHPAPKPAAAHFATGAFYLALTVISAAFALYGLRGLAIQGAGDLLAATANGAGGAGQLGSAWAWMRGLARGLRSVLTADADSCHLTAGMFWDCFVLGKVLAVAVMASAAEKGYLHRFSSRINNNSAYGVLGEAFTALLLSIPITITGLTLLPAMYYCASEFSLASDAGAASGSRLNMREGRRSRSEKTLFGDIFGGSNDISHAAM